jgi:hypothetical protein
MKITISELRQIIRQTIKECYGWPVEREMPLYNAPSNIGKPSQHDPKNSALRMPKGPNSRSSVMRESFNKITARELDQWKKGNWGFISESDEVSEGQESCSECGGNMIEGECSECGSY